MKLPLAYIARNLWVRRLTSVLTAGGMALDESTLLFIMTELYGKTEQANFAGFHPRFLIDQVKAISSFEAVKPEFREDFLRRAWKNLFTHE